MFEQRQDLDRFSQAHVVGQTSAKSKLAKKVQPVQSEGLIISELPLESGWRRARLDTVEGPQTSTEIAELLVDVDQRLIFLGGQQCIEQRGLGGAETKRPFLLPG